MNVTSCLADSKDTNTNEKPIGMCGNRISVRFLKNPHIPKSQPNKLLSEKQCTFLSKEDHKMYLLKHHNMTKVTSIALLSSFT